ncbi:UDP-glucose 4-epimerase family protein [Marinobacter arenosus]|uniref:UDP-glucose 4-epimerase family protein n=1 Tax=Marinobacter arenosus TaxID=2856822 RepID=UPI001C4B04B6|nr:SDR family oxidoreductase [Marinobacter arenosus]MBW0146832.1 SDR family oxidoreductase [Marinobacter arenosus]
MASFGDRLVRLGGEILENFFVTRASAISSTVLVTGATGFVGGALVRALLCEGFKIRCPTRTPKLGMPEGVDQVTGCDLCNDDNWGQVLIGVDFVVHCAAQVHVMNNHSLDPMEEYSRVNVEGTLRVARLAAKAGVKRFLFLSSIKVLGESTAAGAPFREEDEPAPKEAYGRSKLEAEKALFELSSETGMDVVVVRCPLVYGPGVGGNFRALMRLSDSAMPLPFGNIRNLRSMVFIGNLVDFLSHVLKTPIASNQVFLISDGEDISTPHLIRAIREVLGRPYMLWSFPYSWIRVLARIAGKEAVFSRLFDSLQVDSNKSQRLLKWSPPYPLSEGLAATVRAYKGQKSTAGWV